jgi:hypothetical protein
MLTEALVIGGLIGLAQLFKQIGFNAKLIPVLNVLLGIVTSVYLIPYENLGLAIYTGLAYGLASCGLYSGAKAVTEYMTNK